MKVSVELDVVAKYWVDWWLLAREHTVSCSVHTGNADTRIVCVLLVVTIK